MEVPRLRVESGLQPPPTPQPQQCQLLNPLSEARDRTCILMDTNQIRFHCATMGTPKKEIFLTLKIEEKKKSSSPGSFYFDSYFTAHDLF